MRLSVRVAIVAVGQHPRKKFVLTLVSSVAAIERHTFVGGVWPLPVYRETNISIEDE